MPVSMKTLLEQYTKILQKIYGKHLKSVILYGSYARGDYREDSDIDIMILLDLSDIDIKQYRHELAGETFDFNMDHDLDIKPIAKSDAIGKGNAEWNFSAPHGAGRLMSRTKAKTELNMNEYKNVMQGIYTTSINENTLDEAPMAYKRLDDIIDVIGESVDVIDVMKPIYNFKASE